jgi:2',3'-cyclic-nucleotide 2'-phosphodiesterase (5'-nucleotidase family)
VSVRLFHVADIGTAYDDPDRIARLAGGLRAAGADRGDALVVGAGDDGALGVLALLGDGAREALPFLRAVDVAAEAVGNHDLDGGPAACRSFAAAAPAQFLCANADVDTDADADTDTGADADLDFPGSTAVGVSHPETPRLCAGTAGIQFRDPVPAARREIETLRGEGAEYVVVLSHCGDDEPLAAGTDADAVLGGHDHDRRIECVNDTLLVRTAGVGRAFAAVDLGDGAEATVHRTDAFDPAESVRAHYRERRAELGADETVGRITDPIERTRETRFRRESRVGNLVADAYCRAVDADAGLVPAGAIRTGHPLAGAVTVGDVVGTVPFDGPVVGFALSGAELRTVLREAGNPHPGDRGWVQFHVSGLRVRWGADGAVTDARTPAGPIRTKGTYRVATSHYLRRSGDFDPLSAANAVAEGPPQYEALLAHVRERGLDAEREGRITRDGSNKKNA